MHRLLLKLKLRWVRERIRSMSKASTMNQSARPLDEITFPEGTLIKIGGVPFFLAAETVVYGLIENEPFAIAGVATRPHLEDDQ